MPIAAVAGASDGGTEQASPDPASDVSVETRLGWVQTTTDEGLTRTRLTLATWLEESIDPTSSDDPTGIAGFGASEAGVLVAVDSPDLLERAQATVDEALPRVLQEHPELQDFGEIEYEVGSLEGVDQATPAGWEVTNGSGSCSLGATTYTDYLGSRFWYWMTAGHCSPVTPGQSALDGPFNWASGSATGASDSGLWYLGSSPFPPAPAAAVIADGFANKTMLSQSDRPQFDQPGVSTTCQTGAFGGTGCGILLTIWATPIRSVYYIRESNRTACQGGDSGGPWFGSLPEWPGEGSPRV